MTESARPVPVEGTIHRLDGPASRRIAARLRSSERLASAIPSPIAHLVGLSLADAYAIQAAYVRARTNEGAVVRGYKIGAGPPPAFGVLFDDQVLPSGSVIDMATLIRPAVEVEIGFVLGGILRGPNVDVRDVLAATESVVAGFEIVDSRIVGARNELVEIVADNGRAARLVLGELRLPPAEVDLRMAGVVLERNGAVIATGAGAAVFGHPAAAVAWLANELAGHGASIEPGQLILSGALTPAAPARAGDEFRASVAGLRDVVCRFV